MVHLSRIYTKTGDDGTTGLGDGTRISKTHPRIVAYGGVDELNSVLGVVLDQELPAPLPAWLSLIQNDLFDLGADLCVPETVVDESAEENESAATPARSQASPPLRVTAEQVERLEKWIDEANAPLKPLASFILPGGSAAAAHLHLARAVCRRVEIGVWHLAEFENINVHVLTYLNRLSDLLFVLARAVNLQGAGDVLWVPGKHRSG